MSSNQTNLTDKIASLIEKIISSKQNNSIMLHILTSYFLNSFQLLQAPPPANRTSWHSEGNFEPTAAPAEMHKLIRKDSLCKLM